ncbi:MAG TPA: PLP-dependent aminotransferase family protein [Anaerolineales bacterium]|nr:PLP-dependent aminotransferase family protein [Anaerolineales bacterium]
MTTPWEYRYAQRTQRMASSAIRELLKLTALPDMISFAGGLPAPDVFPVAEFQEACNQVLTNAGSQALQYGPTEGYLPLREMIARHTSRYGMQITPNNVLLTSGSQQALDLLGKIFINPGDRILVESPTYLGALQAWNAYGAEYVPVPIDEFGMIPEALEEALRVGPKFIYALPNFQNPSGVTLSLERRHRLLQLAEEHGVPIIEDDPYGQLRYEGEHKPALVVLDGQLHASQDGQYRGNIIYLSTFSKILAPGIRLAWVIAPSQVIDKLVQAKQGADLHTSTFNQMVAYEVSRGGFLDQHIRTIREVYGARRDVMLQALDQYCPPQVLWTRPEGGLFLWATFPDWMDATDVFNEALKRKVAFVPGESFFPHGEIKNCARLNFSNATPEEIRTGIARLGDVLYELLGTPREVRKAIVA